MGPGDQGQPRVVLGTSEARRQLPELVKRASSGGPTGKRLKDSAVEIRTRGEQGSASLVPTAELDAAEATIAALEAERETLEDDLEDAGIALMLAERLSTTTGPRLTAAEFLAGIGMEEFVARLPQR